MKLADANKTRDYVKEQINPYGKPFEGSVYEFGLKIMHYIDNMSADYYIDRFVEELENASKDVSRGYLGKDNNKYHKHYKAVKLSRAIEIVKQGCVSDDVCKWKLEDEEADLYITECNNRKQEFVGTLEEYDYKFCPYCGKKIKIVGD